MCGSTHTRILVRQGTRFLLANIAKCITSNRFRIAYLPIFPHTTGSRNSIGNCGLDKHAQTSMTRKEMEKTRSSLMHAWVCRIWSRINTWIRWIILFFLSDRLVSHRIKKAIKRNNGYTALEQISVREEATWDSTLEFSCRRYESTLIANWTTSATQEYTYNFILFNCFYDTLKRSFQTWNGLETTGASR